MIRAFLALALPESIRAGLALEQALLPLPRRVERENLHLTLAFLGEQPPDLLEDLHLALEGLRFEGFDLTLRGLGHFGSARPRAVWAGVAPSAPLNHLQGQIARAARHLVIPPAQDRFLPHVTLGRFPPLAPHEAPALQRALVERGALSLGPFEVAEVTLYRSRLTAKGARYEVLADYPLHRG